MDSDGVKPNRMTAVLRELHKSATLPELSGDRHFWRNDNRRKSLNDCANWYFSVCQVVSALQFDELSSPERLKLMRKLIKSANAIGFDWYERRVLFGLLLQHGGTAWRLTVERRPVSKKAMPAWRIEQLRRVDRNIVNSAIAGEILYGVESGKTISESILDLAVEGAFGIDDKAIEARWHEWRGMKNVNALLRFIGTGYKLSYDNTLQCHIATRGRGEGFNPLPSASGGRPRKSKKPD